MGQTPTSTANLTKDPPAQNEKRDGTGMGPTGVKATSNLLIPRMLETSSSETQAIHHSGEETTLE